MPSFSDYDYEMSRIYKNVSKRITTVIKSMTCSDLTNSSFIKKKLTFNVCAIEWDAYIRF